MSRAVPYRRRTYRDPTLTGEIETAGSTLWGGAVDGERYHLAKVLFRELPGGWTDADFDTPPDEAAGLCRDIAIRQVDALLSALGLDQIRREPRHR